MKIVARLGVMWFSLSPSLAQTILNRAETIELLAREPTQTGTWVDQDQQRFSTPFLPPFLALLEVARASTSHPSHLGPTSFI
jgi:hypothetical protein